MDYYDWLGGVRKMRKALLRSIYRLFPFNLKGDCILQPAVKKTRISCVINFYGRLDLLQGILFSLSEQKFPKESFEVLLIEDKGGSTAGKIIADSFSDNLQIVYLPLDKNFGKMGYSRNFGLARTSGEIVLFLDDDTVIMQHDFLDVLDRTFVNNPEADAVVPHGHAAYSCIEDRYNYHDPFFMTSRCTAYRRNVLQELGGFISDFVGQEDVEFVARFTIAVKKSINAEKLHYFHPPMIVPNRRKPRAVGSSFYSLKGRYSFVLWVLLLANCARHAPLIMLPARRYREHGRFGLGFIQGVIDGIRGGREQSYG